MSLMEWIIPPYQISASQHFTCTTHQASRMLYQYCAVIWNEEFLHNQPFEISDNIECSRDCLCLHHQKLMWWTTQSSAVFIHPHVLTANKMSKQTNTKDSCVIQYIISCWWRHSFQTQDTDVIFARLTAHSC